MAKTYPFKIDDLSIEYGDLEPVIDKETMMIHHDRHHQAYADNLNKALEENEPLQVQTLEELFKSEIPVVKNNAGGVWNHDFFWKCLSKPGEGHIGDELLARLEKTFGSVEEFMLIFEKTALGRFGSGWAWLVENKEGELEVLSSANQDNPMVDGFKPLLTLDVWEHAYYLKYKNKRADYVKAFWDIVNWDFVEEGLK